LKLFEGEGTLEEFTEDVAEAAVSLLYAGGYFDKVILYYEVYSG
jgi:hypothetical protein